MPLAIAHTNDLHGHIEVFARLSTLIRRARSRYPDLILLDAGDMALDSSLGSLSINLLRSFGYDAVTSGNHENELAPARSALAQCGSPCLVANVAANALGFETPPCLFRHIAGLRVAVLGLTTPPVYPTGHPLHRPKAEEV